MGRLAAEEGQLVASSAAANAIAAKRVARAIRDGEIDAPYDTVATAFPDSSGRYLSKGVYRSFEEGKGRVGSRGRGEKRQRSERRDNRGRLPA